MSAIRTRVYLTEEQRRRIDALVEAKGVSMAEIVRKALDRYLDEEMADATTVLAATFGADPTASPSNRDEWHRGRAARRH
jgi:Arc/MetJ-type ribon-helix-helix transcriptional regulator